VADFEIETLTRAPLPEDWTDLDSRAVDTVRVLAAEAVQKVGNGHPGTAMSLAPLAYALSSGGCGTTRATPTGSAATGSCSRAVRSAGISKVPPNDSDDRGGHGS
jgi:hypothetical protein